MKGYAQLEGPLHNLLCQVPIPAGTKKQKYQQLMRAFKLRDIWTADHTKTFISHKAQLITEPVLSAPVYDGTPFILTTDGSKDAFAGILAQRIKTMLPGGKEVTHLHPIAFASKRTSPSEEKYKLFLLKFAALKYSFDKFSDIVYGYPVEQSGMTSGSCALWIDSVDVVAVRGGNDTVSSLSLRPAPDTSDLSTW